MQGSRIDDHLEFLMNRDSDVYNLMRSALFNKQYSSTELAEILNASGFSTSARAIRRWRQNNG